MLPWLLAPLAAVLAGCAISTPVHLAPAAPGDRPDQRLQVSLTHAVVDPAGRSSFDRSVRVLAQSLRAQPGLVSYSLRRQLFGNEVWTMTVWRSAEDRARFAASPLHRDAMAQGEPALVHFRTLRLEMTRAQLPVDWSRALAALGPAPWIPVEPASQAR